MSKQSKSKNFVKHGSDYVGRHQDEKDRTPMSENEQLDRKKQK